MDLVDGDELGAGKQRRDGRWRLVGDRLRVVVAAVADIEPRAFADRHSAAASEEAMRELAQAVRADDFDAPLTASFRMMMSSSAWLPTMKS